MKPALRIVSSHRGRPPKSGLRQHILDAAERVFSEQDFHEVRMDDIARRSGVAKGTLYLYFPSKRNLYLAVRLEGMDRLRRTLDAVAATPAAPLDRLRKTITSLLGHAWRRRLLVLLLRREQRLDPREARQWLRRREHLSRIVQSAIEQAITARQLRRIDAGAAEEMLFGIVRGLRGNRTRDASIERLAERAMDLFLRGAGVARRRRPAARRRPR